MKLESAEVRDAGKVAASRQALSLLTAATPPFHSHPYVHMPVYQIKSRTLLRWHRDTILLRDSYGTIRCHSCRSARRTDASLCTSAGV